MARRTKEEALATRQQILDAAELCFHERGVSRTSMADIAQAANISRGAVYWHFQNKGEIFQALLENCSLLLGELEEATRNPDTHNPLGHIHLLLTRLFQLTARTPSFRRLQEILLFRCEYTDEPGGLGQLMPRLVHASQTLLAQALANAVAKAQLPADLDLPAAARTLHAYAGGLIRDWLLLPDSYDLHQEAERLATTCLDMLRLSPALRLNG